MSEGQLTQPATLGADGVLDFWKDYVLQARKEIDLEKTEGTRILHLKILLIGALFLLVKGPVGLFAVVLLPLVMYALDRMQFTHLQYILHRWQYLKECALPEIRRFAEFAKARFFEEQVMERHTEKDFYLPVEAVIRTTLCLPAVLASTVAAGTLAVILKAPENHAYIASVIWLLLLVAVVQTAKAVYVQRWSITVAALLLVFLLTDWLLLSEFSIFRVLATFLQDI